MTKLHLFLAVATAFGCYVASVDKKNFPVWVNWTVGVTFAVALYFLMKTVNNLFWTQI